MTDTTRRRQLLEAIGAGAVGTAVASGATTARDGLDTQDSPPAPDAMRDLGNSLGVVNADDAVHTVDVELRRVTPSGRNPTVESARYRLGARGSQSPADHVSVDRVALGGAGTYRLVATLEDGTTATTEFRSAFEELPTNESLTVRVRAGGSLVVRRAVA